jgi:tRNA modification GTPase
MLTPLGRGAVASLLVEGPLALAAVEGLFHPATGPALADRACDRIVYGRWQSPAVGEEVVVCRRDVERIEIHCHGGHAAAAAIIASLAERGCQEIDWRQWAQQSEGDAIASAARIALAVAPTERAAAILWDQYTGALGRALDEVAAEIHAGNAQVAASRLDALIEWSAVGCHLVEPWRVVFAGPPNVGKSSLINALLGYQRAIVHDTPGTTRDVVATASAIDGWPIELADTAGLHATSEPLEAAGICLAHDRLATADLVVLVFDECNCPAGSVESLVERWPTALRVLNKCDLVDPEVANGWLRAGGICTSATRGEGIDGLQREIAGRLVPIAPSPGQPLPFTADQVAMLRQVRAAVSAGALNTASRLAAQARIPHVNAPLAGSLA